MTILYLAGFTFGLFLLIVGALYIIGADSRRGAPRNDKRAEFTASGWTPKGNQIIKTRNVRRPGGGK